VEITGIAGTDLTGWSLLFYNGFDGKQYDAYTFTSSNVIANQSNGFRTLGILVSGIQNGGNDGIALVDASKAVIQFLSYEGILTASDGAAKGMTSQDIGVSESESTATTGSLQLIGSGDDYIPFSFSFFVNMLGAIN